jgi:hypothetical protein
MLEMSLRDITPDVSLPWWDWTSDLYHRNGNPAAYTNPAAPRGPMVSHSHAPTCTARAFPSR